MKGLISIPSTSDLLAAYERLQKPKGPAGPVLITLAEIALWSQWARFDPRLAEQWVAKMSELWREILPFRLREEALKQPWPHALGALLEQVPDSRLIPRSERGVFRQWQKTVSCGFARAPGEQFFIGLRKPGGKQMLLDAQTPNRSYSKWGYFSREILVNKARAAGPAMERTLVAAPARKAVLQELMRTHEKLTIREYREALDFRVSRRQAELDFASENRLAPSGKTRARFYRVRARA